MVIAGVLYYYLQEDRCIFIVIGMDALVAYQISLLSARMTLQALCKRSEVRRSIYTAFGYTAR